MEQQEVLRRWLSPAVGKIVCSVPVPGCNFKKAVVNRIGEGYQCARYTQTQVFHENVAANELEVLVLQLLEEFTQLHGWDDHYQHALRRTKKGKLLYTRSAGTVDNTPPPLSGHNRQKQYLLPQDTVIPPLVDLGVLTPDGRVVKAMYDKYRQINRFVELVNDRLEDLDSTQEISIIDFGCGKSYLTFILYYYLVEVRGLQVRMLGLDLKAEVIRHCNETAAKYGYSRLSFALGDISGYTPAGVVDVVIALHACDTATDHALYNAATWGAKLILSVPCCQHQLNSQMQSRELAILTRYGIIQERAAALMTDAIRANLLTYSGYETQLLEFVDMAHTPKNLLIRAVKGKVSPVARQKALDEVERLMEAFQLEPELYRLLISKK